MTDRPPSPPPHPSEGDGQAGDFCATCGARMLPDARFCTSCGAQRGGATPPTAAPVPPAPVPPAPAGDATRVLPTARVVEREERFVDDGYEPAAYRGPPPPTFNWPMALLILLGLLIVALGLVVFVQAQDDGTTGTTTTVPVTLPTSVVTTPTSSTTLSTTAPAPTTTSPTTTATTAPTTATTTQPTTTTTGLPITVTT